MSEPKPWCPACEMFCMAPYIDNLTPCCDVECEQRSVVPPCGGTGIVKPSCHRCSVLAARVAELEAENTRLRSQCREAAAYVRGEPVPDTLRQHVSAQVDQHLMPLVVRVAELETACRAQVTAWDDRHADEDEANIALTYAERLIRAAITRKSESP